MTKSTSLKKIFAILMIAIMIFAFTVSTATNAYAAEHRFTEVDYNIFSGAFSYGWINFPSIPLEDVGDNMERFFTPDYRYYIENALCIACDEYYDRAYEYDKVCANNPNYSSLDEYYQRILDGVVTVVFGHESQSDFGDLEMEVQSLESYIYDDVLNAVNIICDTALIDGQIGVYKEYPDLKAKWDVNEFYLQTKSLRESVAHNACAALLVSYMKFLPDEAVGYYGSVFSNGSSITMLAIAIAEAVVIVICLAKLKKLKKSN